MNADVAELKAIGCENAGHYASLCMGGFSVEGQRATCERCGKELLGREAQFAVISAAMEDGYLHGFAK